MSEPTPQEIQRALDQLKRVVDFLVEHDPDAMYKLHQAIANAPKASKAA